MLLDDRRHGCSCKMSHAAVLCGAPQPGSVHAHQLPRRVIIHVDLDCFYCQVEQKRLNIPTEVPCAVQQWDGLIAVNYAARAAGVVRHMRVKEAKKVCPELQCVHVQTIGGDHAAAAPAPSAAEGHATGAHATGSTAEDATAVSKAEDPAAAAGQDAAAEDAVVVEGSAADRYSSKASLQRYRKASAETMRMLAQTSPGCAFEKASIDEVYIDVTQLAAVELSKAEGHEGGLSDLMSRAAEGSTVLGAGGLQPDVDFDRLAAAGALIAVRLRGAVQQQLGFTCSAGIGPNKLLAKIGSAKNKPNKQTVVLPRAVEELMQDLPLGKVKGLGGKLGSKLEALGAATAGAAAELSWEVLVDSFGGKALWVWETVRGIDAEPVTPKSLVKSINSCKSFEPTCEPADVSRWLTVLAAELAERMAEDEVEHNRRARTLVLQYRSSSVRNAPDRSIRGALPRCGREGYTTQGLAAAGLALFQRIIPSPFPLVRLALAATEFADLPGHGAGGSSAALQRFLAAGAHQHQQQPAQQEQQGKADVTVSAQPPNSHEHNPQQQREQQQHTQGTFKALAVQQRRKSGDKKQPAQGQARLEQFVTRQPVPVQQQEQQQQLQALDQGQQGQLQQQQAVHPNQQQIPASMQLPGPQQAQLQDVVSSDVHQQHAQLSGVASCTGQHIQGHGQLGQQQESVVTPQLPGQEQEHPNCQHSPSGLQQQPHHQAHQQELDVQQQLQPPALQQQQPQEDMQDLASLAGVDLASQARILRDIEIQGMLRSRHQQQHQQQQQQRAAPGSGRSQAAPKKRKAGQQGQQDSKQLRISNLFGSKP